VQRQRLPGWLRAPLGRPAGFVGADKVLKWLNLSREPGNPWRRPGRGRL